MTLRLHIVSPAGEERRELSQGSAMLGRSRTADVVLSDRFVSRRHARLELRDDVWYVERVEGGKDVALNQRTLASAAPLHSGDVLRLGETTIYVDVGRQAPTPAETFEEGSTIFRSASAMIDLGSAGESLPASEQSRLAHRLRLLNEIHRALAEPLSLQDLLERILERAFATFDAEEGVILLRDGSGGYRRAASRRVAGLESDFLYSRKLVEEVVEKGQAALVLDASADERFAMAESIVSAGVRSIVAAPLLEPEGCRGMIALNSRVAEHCFNEQDLELLVSLASAAGLRVHNVALAEEAAARRVLEKELGLAREIQMSMLPRRLPQRVELELAAQLRPARSVGGDLYAYSELGSELWFLVGDVSGKGVGAALFMAVTRTLFHAMVRPGAGLSDVLERMNRELCRDNERAMFVTAFMGRLDAGSGLLEFASAGHNPPYLLRGGEAPSALTGGHGLPLGIQPDYAYVSSQRTLVPGDALFLFTDGVTEALDPADRAFTESRLEAQLEASAASSASRLVADTLQAVSDFVGDAPQSDDLTVMALRYRG